MDSLEPSCIKKHFLRDVHLYWLYFGLPGRQEHRNMKIEVLQ